MPKSRKLENLESWAKISRGSDLFLKGLGKFDIEGGYRTWKEAVGRMQGGHPIMEFQLVRDKRHYFRKFKLKEPSGRYTDNDDYRLLLCPEFNPIEALLEAIKFGKAKIGCRTTESDLMALIHFSGPRWWFVDVVSFQIHNYFGKFNLDDHTKRHLHYILSGDKECPPRAHLLKYYHGWCKPQNFASLDEMDSVATAMRHGRPHFWPDGWERMRPEQLLRNMREAASQKLENELDSEGLFNHLDSLPDKGRLRILRSRLEIVKTGRIMKNCAANYADIVRDQRAVLITLHHKDAPGKPIALGMIRHNNSSISKSWEQIYLSRNRRAPPEDKQQFYDFKETLQRWHRAQYRTEEDYPSPLPPA